MRPRLRATRFTMLAAALALGLFAFAAPALASTDQDVAYQLDPAHDGYQTNDPITAPLSLAWSDTFPGAVSYPLIANGVLYVTTAEASGYGTTLYAVEQATGATLWSHALGGVYSWSGIAYDAGRVFAINTGGSLSAFDATTGATDWSTALSQPFSSSPPTATGGYVYVGGDGSGGNVYAIAEASGAVAWTMTVNGGDHSSPAVDSTGVYVGYACDQDYGFGPADGTLLWHHSTACTGGGGKTPVLANGELFGRDASEGDVILSAADGSQLGVFSSSFAPAAGDGTLYTASYGGLAAVTDWGLGIPAWGFSGDSKIDTAPIVVGSLVFEGSASGELYAVDRASGAVVWSTNTGHAISAPDEQNADELTGLGAGEGTLIVPAGSTLMAYTGANVGSGIPTNTVTPTVSGTPVTGTPVGADVGVWTALPTSYGYQWSLCDGAGENCSQISTDGTGESYTPNGAEEGDTLEVTVTATNATGTSTSVTSPPSSAIPWPAPTAQSLPTISGTAALGQTLTASTGGWANQPTAYAYRWMRCRTSCSPISGATTANYTVAAADEGGTIEVAVTAYNTTGQTTAASAPTATIATPTTLMLTSSANPSISGSTVTFTATVSPDVDGGTISVALNGTDVPNCTDVPMNGLIGIQCYGPLNGAGTFTITASYSGDGDYGASTASLTQVIDGAPTTSTPAPASGPPTNAPAITSTAPTPVGVVIDGDPSATTRSPTIIYGESGSVTSTLCTIDGVGTQCSASSAELSKLSAGRHTFEVIVVGVGGSANAEVSWVVKSPSPAHSAKHTSKKKHASKHRKNKPARKPKHRARALRRF